ncbi:hypothetical protein LPJ56_005947, partial [Coemansia sp. RSA 2599]
MSTATITAAATATPKCQYRALLEEVISFFIIVLFHTETALDALPFALRMAFIGATFVSGAY